MKEERFLLSGSFRPFSLLKFQIIAIISVLMNVIKTNFNFSFVEFFPLLIVIFERSNFCLYLLENSFFLVHSCFLFHLLSYLMPVLNYIFFYLVYFSSFKWLLIVLAQIILNPNVSIIKILLSLFGRTI